ncbi:hypothetical protein [Agromyces sp. SYSU T0242]|uniref:hypothetical protein n=1 Tax=Agromyces litoreus TaxID=3158561 RepID=UPI00339A9B9F
MTWEGTEISTAFDSPTTDRIVDGMRRTPAWVITTLVLVTLVAMTLVVAQPWLSPTDLVRDGQAVAAKHGDTSSAYGLVSNLGIVVAVLAAGFASAGIVVLASGDRLRALLGWCIGLTLVFALDDLLLLHESTAFGPASGFLLVIGYAVAFATVAIRFREVIVDRLDPALLATMFAALGLSAAVDVLVEPATIASVLVEDGAKLLGVLAWSAFVVRAALVALRAGGERSTDQASRSRTASPHSNPHSRQSKIGASPSDATAMAAAPASTSRSSGP